MFGDDKIGFKGLKKAIEGLTTIVEQLTRDRERTRYILIGIGLGLTLTSGASLLTLFKVISLAAGVPAP